MMRVVSLFSGAGGLDIGFRNAGFNIIWANDFDKNACASYSQNIGTHICCGDINNFLKDLSELQDIDVVIGGPPCQGFSVAGKMNPSDPRSEHVWTYSKVVEALQPRAFVMENVKALGQLTKWAPLREALLQKFRALGYSTSFVVVNAADFDVPQSRERVFFIGFKGNSKLIPDLEKMVEPYKVKSKTVREILQKLDRAGQGNNKGVCNAKITLAPNPVMRKSPFAGMLFNGMGRPVKLDGYCSTLPASMGGNKTPIIDEDELYYGKKGWVQDYHQKLMKGEPAMEFQQAPSRLRRLTVQEAALIQTFPQTYEFRGSQSSIFKQIGNAVPCNLAYNIAKMMRDCLINEEMDRIIFEVTHQLKLEALHG